MKFTISILVVSIEAVRHFPSYEEFRAFNADAFSKSLLPPMEMSVSIFSAQELHHEYCKSFTPNARLDEVIMNVT